MGRELQKKKNKSSINKVKLKPKSKKRINPRGNPIIAANWDKSLTLSQNYARLGLSSKLNARTGGTESKKSEISAPGNPRSEENGFLAIASKKPKNIIPSEAHVERDPATGAILRVVHPKKRRPNPLDDPLNDLSSDESVDEIRRPSGSTGVVRELEEQAALEVKPWPRQQSTRERYWISQLVDKYGDDYGRMMRDRKMNPYQHSEGQLRRKIRIWRESQGSHEALNGST